MKLRSHVRETSGPYPMIDFDAEEKKLKELKKRMREAKKKARAQRTAPAATLMAVPQATVIPIRVAISQPQVRVPVAVPTLAPTQAPPLRPFQAAVRDPVFPSPVKWAPYTPSPSTLIVPPFPYPAFADQAIYRPTTPGRSRDEDDDEEDEVPRRSYFPRGQAASRRPQTYSRRPRRRNLGEEMFDALD